MRRRRTPGVLLAALALTASACTADTDGTGGTGPAETSESAPSSDSGAPSASPSATPSPTESPAESPTESPTGSPEPDDPFETAPRGEVSIPSFARKPMRGGGLRITGTREQTSAYASYDVVYRSNGLRVTGVLNVPRNQGPGPFPAAVLAHGYIDPDIYVQGQGMTRERGYLAERGYVALHTDYRDHAGSSDTNAERQVRLGYAIDAINAVQALRKAPRSLQGERLGRIDDDRIGLFGRSMGGGVVYRALVMRPDIVGAASAWAPVSSKESENLQQFQLDDGADSELVSFIRSEYGLPGTPRGRQFWPGVNAVNYFDRVEAAVQIQHGRLDDTCPPQWTRDTARALRAEGVDTEVEWWPNEGHAFGPAFPAAMDRLIDFFDREL
ncbi:prolyl oligopeptidase family serine peptidase [Nocardioidaceae bacterium]|nr:prolyl oligopeptidase family serine peptidase [Nocardioidaceae bacterium]